MPAASQVRQLRLHWRGRCSVCSCSERCIEYQPSLPAPLRRPCQKSHRRGSISRYFQWLPLCAIAIVAPAALAGPASLVALALQGDDGVGITGMAVDLKEHEGQIWSARGNDELQVSNNAVAQQLKTFMLHTRAVWCVLSFVGLTEDCLPAAAANSAELCCFMCVRVELV